MVTGHWLASSKWHIQSGGRDRTPLLVPTPRLIVLQPDPEANRRETEVGLPRGTLIQKAMENPTRPVFQAEAAVVVSVAVVSMVIYGRMDNRRIHWVGDYHRRMVDGWVRAIAAVSGRVISVVTVVAVMSVMANQADGRSMADARLVVGDGQRR